VTEPSDLARDVLARYRRSISPNADARDVLVQSVVRRAGSGAGPGGGSTPTGGGVPWLVVVASALVVVGGLGWMSAARVGRVDRAFDRAPTIEVAPAIEREPVAVAAVAPAPVVESVAPVVELDPPARPKTPSTARARRGSATTTDASVDEESSLVDEEVRLLRAANLALREGRDGEARAGFDLHAQRFPDGALVELREVGRAILSCRATTPERAAATVDAFGARFPGSPHLARLVRECPTTGAK
jgi:hypothetical protein